MIETILALKIVSLGLAVAYSVPVFVGGAAQGGRVSFGQTLLWTIGVVGFVTLQWLV